MGLRDLGNSLNTLKRSRHTLSLTQHWQAQLLLIVAWNLATSQSIGMWGILTLRPTRALNQKQHFREPPVSPWHVTEHGLVHGLWHSVPGVWAFADDVPLNDFPNLDSGLLDGKHPAAVHLWSIPCVLFSGGAGHLLLRPSCAPFSLLLHHQGLLAGPISHPQPLTIRN